MDGNADGSSGAVHAAEEFASPELKKTAEQYIERDFENVGLEDEEALLPPERKSEISISSPVHDVVTFLVKLFQDLDVFLKSVRTDPGCKLPRKSDLTFVSQR